MDVFVRTYSQAASPLRTIMFELVAERLAGIPGIRVTTIFGRGKDFHRSSKIDAELKTQSEIYCVMDDDQLPIRDDFFEQGAQALANHPEYGMLAGFPMEYCFHGQPFAPSYFNENLEVIEGHSIGCPYFVRKGTLDFPEGSLRQYDGILSKVVTDQGLKTGFARKCLYNHLGYGFSQVEHAS